MKDLAEGLAEGGYRVTVLSNQLDSKAVAEPDNPLLAGHIHRTWNPFLRRLGVLPKFCEYLWFMAFFFFRGLFVRNLDILFVVSTPPLGGLPAAILARLKGARLVYNLQDIFPDSAVVAGILPAGSRAYRWLRKMEQATYRVSDLVVSISASFSAYVQLVVPGKRVETIPNWVDTDHIKPRLEAEDQAITEFRRGGTFVVQYAGNIGFMQNLETLLLAAECLKGEPDIRFIFIGDGNAKQSLKEKAELLGLSNCDFLPLQPLVRVPSVYNACDLGVIPLKPGAAEIAVPSKTWNYLATGRPVIGCVEEGSPLAKVIHESRSGSIVPPNDPGRLAEVILEYRNSPERARAEGRQGRDYVETHLSRRIAIKSFLRIFDQLLDRPNPSNKPEVPIPAVPVE
jgi:colanic acid biosynthesis glycosyl transferase WcaI